MVRFYISLRLKQFLRFYSFSDIHPILGIPVTVVLFLFVSALLLDKAPYPQWLYLLVATGSLTSLQSGKGNSYLKQMLPKADFFKIKLAENFLIIIPFLSIMTWYQCWWQILILIAFIIPYSIISSSLPRLSLGALPVPYTGYSFEFNMAFRSLFAVFVLYITLLVAACFVNNFYVFLVPFFILLLFLQTAYGVIEEPFYIWIYRTSATGFLQRKLKSLCINYAITYMPFALLGITFYANEWPMILLCLLTGLLALSGGMLIKYHFYPSAIVVQISQLLFFGFTIVCLASPLMLPAVILFMVFSFFKARRNLKSLLQC